MTEIDSGRERLGICIGGIGLDLNASILFFIDSALSRNLRVSGEDSRDPNGEVSWVRELARSAIDGDLEAGRALPFRTEKNPVDTPGVGPVVLGVVFVPAPSFSNAFIL